MIRPEKSLYPADSHTPPMAMTGPWRDAPRLEHRNVVWLASYPKSGNTWLRLFLANWFADAKEPINPNATSEWSMNVKCDAPMLYQNALSVDLLKINEDRAQTDLMRRLSLPLREYVQECWARRPPPSATMGMRFIKTHSMVAYWAGHALINPFVTADAICIVRNPINVAPSWARHMETDLATAVEMMCDKETTLVYGPLVNHIGDWSHHVAGWREFGALVIRYEDLPDAFEEILKRLGLPIDERLAKAVEFTTMDRLKAWESDNQFTEANYPGQKFFGATEETLPDDLAERLRAHNEGEMREYGYA